MIKNEYNGFVERIIDNFILCQNIDDIQSKINEVLPKILKGLDNPFSWNQDELLKYTLEVCTKIENDDKDYFEITPNNHPHGHLYIPFTGEMFYKTQLDIPNLWEGYEVTIKLLEDEEKIYSVESLRHNKEENDSNNNNKNKNKNKNRIEGMLDEMLKEKVSQPHWDNPVQVQKYRDNLSDLFDPNLHGYP